MCGRFLFSKVFFDAVIIAGCGHVSGLFARHRWLLALPFDGVDAPSRHLCAKVAVSKLATRRKRSWKRLAL